VVADPLPKPVEPRAARLFNRAVLRPGILILTLTFTYGAVASFVPLLAIQRGVANPGLFFAVYSGSMVAAQAVAGRVSDRFGRSSTALPGLALAGTGLLAISALGGWWLLAAGAIYGLGAGATSPALFAAAGDLAAPGERGSAMATMGLFLELGISSGSIVAGLLAGSLGLATTFVIVAVVPFVGALIGAATGRGGRARPAALA
jgi:MFS family permease